MVADTIVLTDTQLTGNVRYRMGLFRKLILQVEEKKQFEGMTARLVRTMNNRKNNVKWQHGYWRDAVFNDLVILDRLKRV